MQGFDAIFVFVLWVIIFWATLVAAWPLLFYQLLPLPCVGFMRPKRSSHFGRKGNGTVHVTWLQIHQNIAKIWMWISRQSMYVRGNHPSFRTREEFEIYKVGLNQHNPTLYSKWQKTQIFHCRLSSLTLTSLRSNLFRIVGWGALLHSLPAKVVSSYYTQKDGIHHFP